MFKNATSKPKFLEEKPTADAKEVEEVKTEEPVANLEVKVEKVKKPKTKRKCSEKQLLRLEKMRKRKAEINDMKRELKQLKEDKQSKLEVEKLEQQLTTIKGTPIKLVEEVKKEVKKEVKIEPKSILKKEVKTAPTRLDYDILSEKIYNRLVKGMKKPPVKQTPKTKKVVKPKVVKPKVVKQERRGRVAPLSRPTPPVRRSQPRIVANNDNLFSNYLNKRRHNSRRGWV